MKAAIITGAGGTPICGEFSEPVACEGKELITVSASALSQVQQVPILGLALQCGASRASREMVAKLTGISNAPTKQGGHLGRKSSHGS